MSIFLRDQAEAYRNAVCGKCSRTCTWELGVIESFEGGEDIEHLFSRVRGPFHHSVGGRM
jgi:hypothetical protein